jgi:hypothetical protein
MGYFAAFAVRPKPPQKRAICVCQKERRPQKSDTTLPVSWILTDLREAFLFRMRLRLVALDLMLVLLPVVAW